MAKEKKLELHPPADLPRRDSDVRLPYDQFLRISLFAELKSKPTGLDRWPGTLVLRRYRKGEVICRQGEAGWSAFYLLKTDDVLALWQERLKETTDEAERRRVEAEIAALRQEKAGRQGAEAATVATVYLAVPRPPEPGSQSWLSRLTGGLLGGMPAPTAGRKPLYIPIDAPTDLPYDSRTASLREGELFGEQSCIYGTPRSATIVADRDWYALEMLRNILDKVAKDAAYKAKMDELYKKRTLQIHLHGLSIFADLKPEQVDRIRDQVDLLRFEDGQVICDEHERSDSFYIIRKGIVKILKGVSALLRLEDVKDWARLCALLTEGSKPEGPAPERFLAGLLTDPARSAAGRGTPVCHAGVGPLTAEEQQEILQGLNKVIRNRQLPDAKDLQVILKRPSVAARRQDLPKLTKDIPDLELRQFNRLLLEEICGEALVRRQAQAGPPTILSYRARGEFFGEMGLILELPRNATCVAYVHPEPEGQGAAAVWRREGDLVEVVGVPEQVFLQLLEENPSIKEKVNKEIAERQRQNLQRARSPVWDDTQSVLLSEHFQELGLIQGQKLMLIDLDRCTRCDECVRACVDTHADGYSRLFLDGPRFGKYLVPTSCRACLDPVCMIGCPVGSIHRGDNKQMVIENWCIGCELCAKNCPYGSIQMHDIGIIAEGAPGWHYWPGVVGEAWTQPGFRDANWHVGAAPFFSYDRDFQALLAEARQRPDPAGGAADSAVCFRLEFQVGRDLLREARLFEMKLTSMDEAALVWINGHKIETEEKAKRDGSRLYRIAPGQKILQAGRNVLAVRVTPKASDVKTVLDLRLDEQRAPVVPLGLTPEELSEKVVTEVAVVCDMCSQQFGQKPACVNACPHDAAMRVDARFEFPVR